jgi:MoaA/NifB/PqqE/SkfB family radical SAM enzyme
VSVSRSPYVVYVEVFSHCNLRCPTCIVGNKYGDTKSWPRGVMDPALLGRILDKAKSECDIRSVGLYSWAEPLLHPDIASIVREVKSRGLRCELSSSLNVLRRPDELMAANPDALRVSVSGFSQPVYAVGHRGGNIEKVKRNMERLAEAKARTGAGTAIEVFYHRYRHNASEIAPMAALAHSLGFEFRTFLAQIFPVEKIIDISEGRTSAQDRATLDTLALPLDRALAVTSRSPKTSCNLRDEVLPIDVHGRVMLCPSSSMNASNAAGSFLDLPLAELQRRRAQHSLCGGCMKLGLSDYLQAVPAEFESIAAKTIEGRSLSGLIRSIKGGIRSVIVRDGEQRATL